MSVAVDLLIIDTRIQCDVGTYSANLYNSVHKMFSCRQKY